MTMSSAKKKQSISDQINDILKPKELTEENDENEARFEEFTEHTEGVSQLSDIRKQTARSLNELDQKYEGKAVSRKDLELDGFSSDEEGQSADDSEQDQSNEDMFSDEEGDDDDGDESEDGSGSDDEDQDDEEEDDFDITQFSKPHPSSANAAILSQDQTKILKDASIDEEIKKGICVQNQLKLWEKLLEVRIKSQKMLITANSMPDYDAHLELSTLEDSEFSEKVEQTCDGIHGLLDNLLDLQCTLVNKFPESKYVMKSVKRKKNQNGAGNLLKRSKLAEYSDHIEESHNSYSTYRSQVLQKWHERTKSAKDTKNPTANLSITTKIENSLLGKNEMIRKSQIYRGDYDVYGVEKPVESDGIQQELQLTEIFDDSEFYHQLLRELIEYKSNTDENQSEITKKFIELQKVRSKMKKKVDTRASKGRKIRYVVHNKLVNYMPPIDTGDFSEEAKTELYNSLFGMANQSETL